MKIRNNPPLIIKTLVLLIATSALYWQDFVIITNDALHSDLSTHILVIPLLIIYIIYRKRKILIATTSNQFSTTQHDKNILIKDITGTLLCIVAYLIKWYGSSTFQPIEYHIASLPIFVVGLTLVIFNTQTLRSLIFSIAFLYFLVPPPTRLALEAGSVLATLNARIAFKILKSIGIPVILSNTYMSPIIYLETLSGTQIPFAIDVACSGLYSFIGFTIFAVFIAYIIRDPLYKKITIFAMGLPIIYSLNIIRIIMIVIIGHVSGPNIAFNIFHILGGWTLILIGTLVIFIISEKALNIQIFKSKSRQCNRCNNYEDAKYCMDCGKVLKIYPNKMPRNDLLKTVFITIFTILLMFIQVPVFALTEGAAEVFIQQPTGVYTITKILPEIEEYDVRFVYRDVEFEKISGQNASLTFQYLSKTFKKPIWIGIEVAPTKLQLHPWEVCLITTPETHGREAQVSQLDLRDVHLLDNPPLTARYFAFQRKDYNETQVILYWYIRSTFKTAEGHQQKWTKISVIQFTNNPNEYRNMEEELLPVAKAIANYWQPITNWSWISLTIAKNGLIMITITTFILIIIILMAFRNDIEKKTIAKYTHSQISNLDDLQIIDSIKALEKETATVSKIAKKYKEISGKDLELERLRIKLKVAENIKIIKKKIINVNDEPYISWETNF